ncbi:MAG: hypothetical protein AAF125_12245, partial [Chloroflexota bacterium]
MLYVGLGVYPVEQVADHRAVFDRQMALLPVAGGVNAYAFRRHTGGYETFWFRSVNEAMVIAEERLGVPCGNWVTLGTLFRLDGQAAQQHEQIEHILAAYYQLHVQGGWTGHDMIKHLRWAGVSKLEAPAIAREVRDMAHDQLAATYRHRVAVPYVIWQLRASTSRIPAIKLYRMMTWAGLRDSRDRVYEIADRMQK